MDWRGYSVRFVNRKVDEDEWSNSIRPDARSRRVAYDIVLDLPIGPVIAGKVQMTQFNFRTAGNREWWATGIARRKHWPPYSEFLSTREEATADLLDKQYPDHAAPALPDADAATGGEGKDNGAQ